MYYSFLTNPLFGTSEEHPCCPSCVSSCINYEGIYSPSYKYWHTLLYNALVVLGVFFGLKKPQFSCDKVLDMFYLIMATSQYHVLVYCFLVPLFISCIIMGPISASVIIFLRCIISNNSSESNEIIICKWTHWTVSI